MKSINYTELLYGSSFFILLLLTAGLYWPGLYGTFLLDDDPNLQPLATISQFNTFSELSQFVIEGGAGPLGRPLTLLTFALQHHRWPTDPFSFKYVNLMLHLLNGCLVFWFILQINRLVVPAPRNLTLALLVTGVWLLTPIQVSTVLYVVQRMTQLATLFTLLGLIAYLHGKQLLAKNRLIIGYLTITLGVGIGGTLAILSKESGALLLLYILVLEWTVLRKFPQPLYWRYWLTLFIYAPVLILLAYFTFFIDITASYSGRDFTLLERLLTETRALTHYVAKTLLLHPRDFGLFHDDYLISKGLLTPPLTLITTLLITGSLIAAGIWRRTYPLLAFGILWFYAGHVIESSFLGLVPYFEHRNYLPLLGILFATGYGINSVLTQMKTPSLRRLSMLLIGMWLLLFPTLTWLQTTLWGKPLLQAEIWATQKPFSRFAQSHAALLFDAVGQDEKAATYYQQMVESFPKDTGPSVLWLSLACRHPRITPPDVTLALPRLRQGKIDSAAISGLNDILIAKRNGRCYLKSDLLEEIFVALTNNINDIPSELYQLYAMFLAQEKRYPEALAQLDRALALKKEVKMRLNRVQWLVAARRWEEALLDVQKIRGELNPVEIRLYSNELDQWEAHLKFLLKNFAPPSTP